MSQQRFLSEVEGLFLSIEEWLETHHSALDFETNEGLLTVYLPMGKQMIFSRQLALSEIWLACPQGAYHFHKKADQWVTQSGEELMSLLTQVIEKYDEDVS